MSIVKERKVDSLKKNEQTVRKKSVRSSSKGQAVKANKRRNKISQQSGAIKRKQKSNTDDNHSQLFPLGKETTMNDVHEGGNLHDDLQSILKHETEHSHPAQKELRGTESTEKSESRKIAEFIAHCEKSKHLKQTKRSSRSKETIALQLPDGLPSKLLLRALQHERQDYSVLDEQIVQSSQEDVNSIEVLLNSIDLEKITTLVKELDKLVSQFTARS